ncbi:helix-turn-helix domain-containing protein [Thermomonospora cellulosilytica]|uniref:HTH cro/C1-type domain-containing protein n=1 Tax=Thermomonospora cellulosilytica TaxID=1411118 RepID=A0A7W3MTK7_9ACTN|nr:helix-turn-helix domain-containing protein [Thermomonospora cellulosilytica]MBA9001656.1 hypothetical protein [Thermomonospora cellulosilytica]
MNQRVIELELEIADWLDQLLPARFAFAAFAIHLIASYGALRADHRVQRLGDRFRQVNVLRFYIDTEPTGLSYWCTPQRRIVLLTVWRIARIPEAAEAARARQALRDCSAHPPQEHRLWSEFVPRRMREPGVAETYREAAAAHAFGQTVRLLRRRRRLSIGQLAAAVGTTDALITRCEAGGLPTAASLAARIATVLDCEHALARPPEGT